MSPGARHVIIGTAGHVDHGKTTLVRALTGQETDRLAEEQERGISIDLGFAMFRMPSGRVAGVVDVPGHERFISNMLAGVVGLDVVLLVIDVLESVMPQTREHLQIMELLGVRRGIVVLSKVDLADEEWVDMVEEEVREEIAGTFLGGGPICRVDAVSGTGLDELVVALEAAVGGIDLRDVDGPMRLPVDRHFTVRGFGTVVTGTLVSGSVAVGDTVEVLPAGLKARVRELQVHGDRVDRAQAGQRVALNLSGLERADVDRGAVVATPGAFAMTGRIDARVALLPGSRPLEFREQVHLYLGTARTVARVALLDRDELEPGEEAYAQLHLARPLVAHRRDAFVIRSYSPMTTLGGGTVIDPRPSRHRRFRAEVLDGLDRLASGDEGFLLQKLAASPCLRAEALASVAGMHVEVARARLRALEAAGEVACLSEQWVIVRDLTAWHGWLVAEVERSHGEAPLLPGLPHATLKACLPEAMSRKAFEQLLGELCAEGLLQVDGEWVRRPGFVPVPDPDQAAEIARLEQLYLDAGVQVHRRSEVVERLGMAPDRVEPYFGYLVQRGELVRVDADTYFHVSAYRRATEALRAHFSVHETLSLPQFRDRLGGGRKRIQALLEHFDRQRFTQRHGDVRVAVRLPELAE